MSYKLFHFILMYNNIRPDSGDYVTYFQPICYVSHSMGDGEPSIWRTKVLMSDHHPTGLETLPPRDLYMRASQGLTLDLRLLLGGR